MSGHGPWSDEENEAIVGAYFEMLDEEAAGRPYSKAAMRRRLQQGALSKRTSGSIEYKMQNISGVLDDYEQAWIEGYKPARNYQRELEAAVLIELNGRGIDVSKKPRKP